MGIINGPDQEYRDAIKVFENGYGLIKAFKEKYGHSYRVTIRAALNMAHDAGVELFASD